MKPDVAGHMVAISFDMKWQAPIVIFPPLVQILGPLHLVAWGMGFLQAIACHRRDGYMVRQMNEWSQKALLPFLGGCVRSVSGDVEPIGPTLLYGAMFLTQFIIRTEDWTKKRKSSKRRWRRSWS